MHHEIAVEFSGTQTAFQAPPEETGSLTTHVLDLCRGQPAAGMTIELWWLGGGEHRLLLTLQTNADGRSSGPLLAGADVRVGQYELAFHVGSYFRSRISSLPDPPFLDIVPVRFGLADSGAHYHVPLLVTPWSYSTYRGS